MGGCSLESLESRIPDDPFIKKWFSQFGDKNEVWPNDITDVIVSTNDAVGFQDVEKEKQQIGNEDDRVVDDSDTTIPNCVIKGNGVKFIKNDNVLVDDVLNEMIKCSFKMIEYHLVDMRLKDLMMMVIVMHTEEDDTVLAICDGEFRDRANLYEIERFDDDGDCDAYRGG
nr:hypothetical protein [Tanacetum cinerariifolium]